ncbi:MAG: tetratricopeptide repeat protein [Candidatus Omnitrophica bacterium]|nr:tetratricopeptide repeat protein [Candidatus Omnitrophota bacterium]
MSGPPYLSIIQYNNSGSPKLKSTYRIICLGESTTAGQYPRLLEKILNTRCPEIKISVIDKGAPAITTSCIISHLKENLETYKPDMVVVMMGINEGDELTPAIKAMISDKRTFSFQAFKLIELIWFRIAGPAADVICVERGQEYYNLGKFAEAEAEFKKAIKINPKNDNAYGYLVRTYNDRGKHIESEALFDEAMRNNPHNYQAYLWMGAGYRKRGEYHLAEAMLKKAIKILPQDDSPYIELFAMYMQSKGFNEAEEILKEAIRSSVVTTRIKRAVSILYAETGKRQLSDKYAAEGNSAKMKTVTIANYRELWKIVKNRGMQLVCVQYPMRDIELIKGIFKEEPGIIFVDNKQIFQEAMRNEGLQAYFIDMFGGDFGHCTLKGNRLLAENIAKVILREVFGK